MRSACERGHQLLRACVEQGMFQVKGAWLQGTFEKGEVGVVRQP
jgi:hypothetical protein